MLTDLPHKLFELFLAADRNSADKLIEKWADVNCYERAMTEIQEIDQRGLKAFL